MNPYWIAIGFTLAAQAIVLLRWLHRRMRDAEIQRAFVRDMATNHLPHVYHALRLIAARLGVELGEPPPLRFLDLSEKETGAQSRHP